MDGYLEEQQRPVSKTALGRSESEIPKRYSQKPRPSSTLHTHPLNNLHKDLGWPNILMETGDRPVPGRFLERQVTCPGDLLKF